MTSMQTRSPEAATKHELDFHREHFTRRKKRALVAKATKATFIKKLLARAMSPDTESRTSENVKENISFTLLYQHVSAPSLT
jgi:hypothetical protein